MEMTATMIESPSCVRQHNSFDLDARNRQAPADARTQHRCLAMCALLVVLLTRSGTPLSQSTRLVRAMTIGVFNNSGALADPADEARSE